ncbi:hypothetical protein [Nocardioides sp. TF02-7]|uniref:hypothetical protein n=1 Tax=Nocardioides sp. TF02-7 TaxID=2917724 RepID=UPI001F065319|nr:hypothetical protein [Nocardioides sp. TF02-7]UMG94360.1 hypothetical protein MF408_10355 [Nocardioides sp. TF02-7]
MPAEHVDQPEQRPRLPGVADAVDGLAVRGQVRRAHQQQALGVGRARRQPGDPLDVRRVGLDHLLDGGDLVLLDRSQRHRHGRQRRAAGGGAS